MADEKKSDAISESGLDRQLYEISEFIDYNSFNKIINKLTDLAEILGEGKISGLINYNFRLNSVQTGRVIKLMESIQGISKIYILALKGAKDLEVEYISNIFSTPENPEHISSFQSLKNHIENRLTTQVQQYNINMQKNNTTMLIPLNELRGHVKTFLDLSELDLTVSTKAQHGIIAASLHDAYITLLNSHNFADDKNYKKFFFSEDDPAKRKMLLLRKEQRLSLQTISSRVRELLEKLYELQSNRQQIARETQAAGMLVPDYTPPAPKPDAFTDRMMRTPFGRQYGGIIEKILSRIFDPALKETYRSVAEDTMRERISLLFKSFRLKIDMNSYREEIVDIANYLLVQEYGIKTFAEKFIYSDRRESFSKFYSEQNQGLIEQFLNTVFLAYFEESFISLFRIIKSMDMKKFACAFIIKRVYLSEGENLSNFGFFFIKVIAKSGGIKSQ